MKVVYACCLTPYSYAEIVYPRGIVRGYRYYTDTKRLVDGNGLKLDITEEEKDKIIFAILQALATQ